MSACCGRGARPGAPLARDVVHVGWLAGYIALLLIWHAADNRAAGLGSGETLLAGIPLTVLSLIVLGACAGFAWAVARTTTYTVTTERVILRYGIALTASLSIPLRKVAALSIAVHGDGTGDLLLQVKPGTRMGFLKLWPHVRPWRFRQAQPMLRGVPGVADVAAKLSQATAAVCVGVLHAMPDGMTGVAQGAAGHVVDLPVGPTLSPPILSPAILSPAGD